MTIGIYQIRNLVNDHAYIGQSINIEHRKNEHFSKLKRGKHNSYLQNAYNKYGKENFIFETILECEEKDLIYFEQFFVDTYKPEYNLMLECVESRKGVTASDETRQKMSRAAKGNKNCLGYSHSDEARLNMSNAKKGNKYSLGISHSDEYKKKMSEVIKGKKHTDESKKKMSEAKKLYWKNKKNLALSPYPG